MANLFYKGLFSTLNEFKFTDFLIEPYSFMILIDSFILNPCIIHLDLSRNEINEDIAAAIIQRLYGNSSLKKINLDGNPISIGLFNDNFIKPYFSSRKDLKIVLA